MFWSYSFSSFSEVFVRWDSPPRSGRVWDCSLPFLPLPTSEVLALPVFFPMRSRVLVLWSKRTLGEHFDFFWAVNFVPLCRAVLGLPCHFPQRNVIPRSVFPCDATGVWQGALPEIANYLTCCRASPLGLSTFFLLNAEFGILLRADLRRTSTPLGPFPPFVSFFHP